MLATTEKKEQSTGIATAVPAKDKELEAMREAYRVAQELEKQEEEEMIRKAIEESERMQSAQKSALDEEEEMFRKVLEMSQKEEDDRVRRMTSQKDQEDKLIEQSLREAEAEKGRAAAVKSVAKPKLEVSAPMTQVPRPIIGEEEVYMTAEQLHQREIDQLKLEEMRKLREKQKAQPAIVEPQPVSNNNLPPVGRPMMMGLPSIGSRGGKFEVDADALRKANLELDKLNDLSLMDKKEAVQDNRSMMEVMQAKRKATEQSIEESKTKQESKTESIDERKQRLLAQRDLLRQMNNNERAKELEDFNAKASEELKGHSAPKMGAPMDELEKRRQIMKNVKKEIDKDEAIAKAKSYERKMSELEQKASEKEAQKKKEEILQAEREKK